MAAPETPGPGLFRVLGLGRFARAVVLAAAALFVVSFGQSLILRVAWPQLAVECALRQGSRVDPWGRPFVFDLKSGFAFHCHSVGPNGIDENGGGDDLSGMAGSVAFAIYEPQPLLSLLALAIAPGHLRLDVPTGPLLVDVRTAAVGAFALLCHLVALAWRVTRPEASSSPPDERSDAA